MENVVHGLASVLEKQIQSYGELNTLVLEERKALVSNDLKALSHVTSDMRALIAFLNLLEVERADLAKELAGRLNLSEPTLPSIAARLDEPESKTLLQLRDRAKEALSEVQRHARTNGEMLEYCAGLVDSILRGLVEPEPSGGTYGSTGRTRSAGGRVPLLDHHV